MTALWLQSFVEKLEDGFRFVGLLFGGRIVLQDQETASLFSRQGEDILDEFLGSDVHMNTNPRVLLTVKGI